jgi:uncharacterized membrane protein YkoI
MRRVTLILVAMAVMVPLFAVVAYAAAGGNAANVSTLLVIAAAVAMLVALGGAGIAYANRADSEEQVTGPDAEKAKSAAIAAVGGGTVTEVERDDDGYGTGVFEVEVTRDDGTQVEVHLDGDYNVVGQQADED